MCVREPHAYVSTRDSISFLQLGYEADLIDKSISRTEHRDCYGRIFTIRANVSGQCADAEGSYLCYRNGNMAFSASLPESLCSARRLDRYVCLRGVIVIAKSAIATYNMIISKR